MHGIVLVVLQQATTSLVASKNSSAAAAAAAAGRPATPHMFKVIKMTLSGVLLYPCTGSVREVSNDANHRAVNEWASE